MNRPPNVGMKNTTIAKNVRNSPTPTMSLSV
jgi:hypothetical protein